jgi:hypothetical protein
MKHLAILIVVAASLLAHSQSKTVVGEIRGTVADQLGAPVAGATVYAVPQDLGLNDISPRSVTADSNGRFVFRGNLQLGSYKLYAKKDNESYPDPFDRFYVDAKAEAPTVKISADHPSANAKVKLGRQAAVLTGRVIDEKTGESVKAYLGLLDSEGHGHSIFADGTYRVLLPPGKEVTVMVTILDAGGDHASLPIAPLKLEAGQYVSMDIPVSRGQ